MASQKSNLQTWFQWFTNWVRDFAQKLRSSAERKLLVVDTLESRDGCTIARSVLRNTPGSVVTWYIGHKNFPNVHLIIALDNIFELKKFLEEPIPDDTVHVCRTHLISIQWLLRVGKNRRQVYKFKGAWLGDFQGRSDSINAKASDVVRYLVIEVINMHPLAGIGWETRLDKYEWEDAIVSKCKVIADSHRPYLKKVKKIDILAEGNRHG